MKISSGPVRALVLQIPGHYLQYQVILQKQVESTSEYNNQYLYIIQLPTTNSSRKDGKLSTERLCDKEREVDHGNWEYLEIVSLFFQR